MPNPKIPLEPGCYYHIYNRGINRSSIFFENSNYRHFLRLYDKYISQVANTLAWVLMGNHFHLLVQILPPHLLFPDGSQNNQDLIDKTDERIIQQFSNLFNAYSKAINKRYNRTGSLFEHTFRRKKITDIEYLKKVVLYIHHNPVNHEFCTHPSEYPWSSYLSYVSIESSNPERKTVIGWFNNEADFLSLHNKKFDPGPLEEWLEMSDYL